VRGGRATSTSCAAALVVVAAAERTRQMSPHRALQVAHRRRPRDDVISGPRDRLRRGVVDARRGGVGDVTGMVMRGGRIHVGVA